MKNVLTYANVEEILRGFDKVDEEFRSKVLVVIAVYQNLPIADASANLANYICKRIDEYWVAHDCDADLDDFCFAISDQSEDLSAGLSDECLSNAWEQALEMGRYRLG